MRGYDRFQKSCSHYFSKMNITPLPGTRMCSPCHPSRVYNNREIIEKPNNVNTHTIVLQTIGLDETVSASTASSTLDMSSNASRVRARKEARTRQRFKKSGQKNKKSYNSNPELNTTRGVSGGRVWKIANPCELAGNWNESSTLDETSRSKETHSRSLVDHEPDIGYVGLYVCLEDYKNGLFWNGKYVNDQDVYQYLARGTVVPNVAMSGPGFIVAARDGKTEVMTSCCDPDAGFIPLLRRLQTEHPFMRRTMEEMQINSIIAMAGQYGTHRRIEQTAKDYIQRKQHTSRAITTEITLSNGESIFATKISPTVALYPDAHRIGRPEVLPFQRCDIREEWVARNTVKSIVHVYRGVKNEICGPINNESIRFTEYECNARHCTTYFRFIGVNQAPFVWYELSTDSMELGVKRILAARDNEEEYDHNECAFEMAARARISSEGPKFSQIIEAARSTDPRRQEPPASQLHTKVVEHFFRIFKPRLRTTYVQKVIDKLHGKYDHIRDFLAEGFDRMWSFFGRDLMRTIPHVKKKIRSAYVDGIKLHDRLNNLVKRIEAHVKVEPAKPGKVPRLFVSYDAGCMYANHLPEMVKLSINGAHRFVIGDVTFDICIVAVDVNIGMNTAIMNLLTVLQSTNHVYIIIYSDDSVFVGNVGGKAFAFNVDISSCDASQGVTIFSIVGWMLGRFNVSESVGLIKQCRAPIYLSNKDKSEQFIITLNRPFEGSGTVLTTILNHTATFFIALTFAHLSEGNITALSDPNNVKQLIVTAASTVGHKVTTDWAGVGVCVVPERIQFLKYSPLMSIEGVMVPALNYGAIFRSFGIVEGDLLPEQLGLKTAEFQDLSTQQRADIFFSRVVASLVNEPSSRIIDALRQRFGRTSDPHFTRFLTNETPRSHFTIDENSICRRYDITSADITELVACILDLKVGDVISSRAIAAFYYVDYSLPYSA